MDLKKQYLECKHRNEQQASNIQSLESRILAIQNKIKLKQSSIKASKQTTCQYDSLIHSHKEFQRNVTNAVINEQKETIKPNARHDLTHLVTTTPEKITKKLESLIQRQIKDKVPVTDSEIAQVLNLIQHLPNRHDMQQFNFLVDELKSKLETIEIVKSKYEPEDIKNSLQYHSIFDYLNDQKQRVKELSKKKKELELNTKLAEMQLIKQVRQLYREPELQSVITKHMRLKAACVQADVELTSTKEQIDKIHRKIQSIEDSTDAHNMEMSITGLLRRLHKKQEQVQSLQATNKKFREFFKNRKIHAVINEEHELLQELSTSKHTVKRPKPEPMVEDPSTTADESLAIRHAISPTSLISTTQAISEIVNTIDSVNILSRNSVVNLCADIRVKLEQLVNNWDTSLDKQGVDKSNELPLDYDGIDAVIQSVDTLTTYIQNKELSYIRDQEQKIQSKLVVADNIEKEIKATQNSLDQRSLITAIGEEYTVENKSFAEWLDILK